MAFLGRGGCGGRFGRSKLTPLHWLRRRICYVFLVTITSLGCISASLRLKTGSIWPSIILHAAWNSILVEIADAFTRGTDTSLWTGEAGILVALTTTVIALLIGLRARAS
jgi:membrane protease YdiL (CAAX protease family)